MIKFRFPRPTRNLIFALALFAFVLLIYSNAIKGGFVWEDDDFIRENILVRKLGYASNFFNPSYWSEFNPFHSRFRPLRSLSFSLEYGLWGLNPKWFHLTNIALHGANSALVYFLFASLLGGSAWLGALFSALIFASHPVHVESVAYIKNRTDLMATLFLLISWILYSKSALRRGEDGSISNYPSYYLSIAFFALALLAKEVAIIFPILALLGGYCHGRRINRPWLKLSPFFAMSALYALFLFLAVGGGKLSHQRGPELSYLLGASLVIKTYAYYFRMIFLPGEFNADAIFFIPLSIYSRDVIYSGVIFAVAAFFLAYAARSNRALFFAFGWAMITILPMANLSTILGRLVAEQRAYLPSVGYSLMMGMALNRVWGASGRLRAGTAMFLALGMLFTFSISSWNRIFVWRDDLSLWTDTVRKSAGKSRAHLNYANALKNSRSADKAINEYQVALLLSPNFPLVRSNLANAFDGKGYFDRSVAENLTALFADPQLIDANNNLANLLNRAGLEDRSIMLYKKALSINPVKATVLNNLATVYLNKGLEGRAFSAYAKAYEFSAQLLQARVNRAILLIRGGFYDKAASALAAILMAYPDDAAANNLLGVVYSRRGQYSRAVSYFNTALSGKPLDPELHLRLANAYQFRSIYDKALAEYFLALGLDRDSALTHKNLALLYMNHLRKDMKALRHFEISLQLSPTQPQAEGIREFIVELSARTGAPGR